jgi:hypothetical protein
MRIHQNFRGLYAKAAQDVSIASGDRTNQGQNSNIKQKDSPVFPALEKGPLRSRL